MTILPPFLRRHFQMHFFMKIYEFRVSFHRSLFLRLELTIIRQYGANPLSEANNGMFHWRIMKNLKLKFIGICFNEGQNYKYLGNIFRLLEESVRTYFETHTVCVSKYVCDIPILGVSHSPSCHWYIIIHEVCVLDLNRTNFRMATRGNTFSILC